MAFENRSIHLNVCLNIYFKNSLFYLLKVYSMHEVFCIANVETSFKDRHCHCCPVGLFERRTT